MSPRLDDTIVAASTPPGRSPRGIVRLSGPQARRITGNLITSKFRGADASARDALQHARRLTPCVVDVPPVIPAMVSWCAGPLSYTAQDLIELHVPGNPALLDRIIHRVTDLGARLAEPGEFTFRAYVAGKLDLTQAEGVAATIAAVSDSQLDAARLLEQGELGRFAATFVDDLATELALVEAGIDFTDQDDVVPISPGKLHDDLTTLSARLDDLLTHSRSWGAVESLPRVVLVGAPSTGKSTLFNALLGRPRAVISPTPGTTRDVLTEPLTLPSRSRLSAPVEVLLIDIAGLDDPLCALDHQVQQSARDAIARADLVLRIHDHSSRASAASPLLPARVPVVTVRTKCDLPRADTDSHVRANVSVSAVTGAGLDELRHLIVERLGDRAVSVSGDLLALQPRHEAALRAARGHLDATLALLSPQHCRHAIENVELVAGALRAVLDAMAGLGGQMTPDDVIGRVFATFCVGK